MGYRTAHMLNIEVVEVSEEDRERVADYLERKHREGADIGCYLLEEGWNEATSHWDTYRKDMVEMSLSRSKFG